MHLKCMCSILSVICSLTLKGERHKKDGYKLSDDLFLMQNNFCSEEEINTQKAVKTANALDQFLDHDHREFSNGEPFELLDLSNQHDNTFKVTDDMVDDLTDFPEVLHSFKCQQVCVAFLLYVMMLWNFAVLLK